MDSALALPGLWVPERPKLIVPNTPWMPTRHGFEVAWDGLDKDMRAFYEKWFKTPALKDRIHMMSGSLAFYSSKKLQDSLWGKTAFTAATTIYFALYTAALDDTFNGATANEATYTSYARMGLTNNTTIFAAGTGTTTYSKTMPSDATKSWATSTGGASTITYLGAEDGNAGTSGDNGYAWCSVTSTPIANGDTPQIAQNALTVTQD